MSNYCVTGYLNQAAEAVYRARDSMPVWTIENPDRVQDLRDDLASIETRIKRAMERAKKLIPGGWKPANPSIVPEVRP